MKTKIAMIAFMAMSFVVMAQNDYLTGQTKLVNPSGRTLLLERNDDDSWLTFHKSGSAWFSMGIDQSNTNNFSLNYGGGLTSSQFVLTKDGKVGIGTSIPQSKFVVKDYNTGMSIGMANNIVGFGFNRNVNGGQVYDENVSGWQFTARDERFSLEGYNGAKSNLFNVLKNENIGIGTKTPTQSLDINGHVKFDALSSSHTNLQIGHDVNDRIIVDNSLTKPYGGGYFFRVTPDPSLNISANYIDVMMLTDKGKVGIGTGTPSEKLDVNGRAIVHSLSLGGNNAIASVNGFSNKLQFTGGLHGTIVFHPGGRDELMFGLHTNGYFYWGIGRLATKPDFYSMYLNGNTGDIGIIGKLTSNEVKVKLGGWADFVFKDDYKLPTLKEVENHIKTKGHLENIPSAKEVAKNGVLLGEMNKSLLQKIEELTLYTIQQEKEIEKLKEKNKEIKSLSERLAKLEKLLEK